MYSPQEHTLTTGREPVAWLRKATDARKAQASAPAAPRRTQRKRGSASFCRRRSNAEGRRTIPLRSRLSCRASFTLEITSSASTDRNSRVEMALTSGVTRFLVMP